MTGLMILAFWAQFWATFWERRPSAEVINLADWRRDHPRHGEAA